ncbi:MAG: hypothetical protein QM708_05055 [Propioniciclava sp.]|uniref:hypothetical protein n=1 Tax=Propioniciclava sp. TaxID=2038686 RepID=UPI0039E616B8
MDQTDPTPSKATPEPADTPAPPASATEDQPAKRSRRPLVIAGSALLVVVLIAVVAWAAISTSTTARLNAIKNSAMTYLTALSTADADAALDSLAERPANTALLTRGVLEASLRDAPLTGIEVSDAQENGDQATVRATYKLGDREVSTQLQIVGKAGRDWKIADGTADLSVPVVAGVAINGASLTETVNPVFPGVYTAAASSEFLSVTGEQTQAVVTDPAQEGGTIAVTAALSDAGREAVLSTVKTRFDECLASTVSRPADCPFGFSEDGVEIAPDSVRFSLTNDPWADFAPTVDPATLLASGTFHFEVTGTATATAFGLTGDVSRSQVADRAYEVDLSKDPRVVVWR